MAELDPSATPRYFLDYEGPMGKRTMQFRVTAATSTSVAVAAISGFIQAMTPWVYSSVEFYGLRFAAQGVDFSNPVTWSPISGAAAGTLQQSEYPRFIAWAGRSPDSRRVRLYMYGVTSAITPDYRLNYGESGPADAGINYLNSAQSPFVAIGGMIPIWKNYANQGYNSYHQRKRRQVA